MRTVFIFLLFLLALPAQAQFPVLVYDTSGGRGQFDTTVNVNVVGASNATEVCAKVHQASYHTGEYIWSDWNRRDDAAGINLNSGTFVTNWNSTSTVDANSASYEGVGGAFHTNTVCFTEASLGTITEGSNTMGFRFYGVQDLARSGYRVLDIWVNDSGGNDLATGKTYADPETWTITNTVGGSYDNGTAISAGQTLWTSAALTEIDGVTSINANCADCHVSTGIDLKYFNYEPDVIITRARHHNLTEDEGRKIAAYILSLDNQRTDGRETTPKGRPWNPPYQPGPGIVDGLEEDFTAGAGLDWVLNDDSETFDYIFSTDGVTPNTNPSTTDIQNAFDVGSYSGSDFGNILPIQDIPVALQYPDWNTWLPDIHPIDGFNNFTSQQLYTDCVTTFPNAFDTPTEVANAASAYGNYIARGTTNPRPALVQTPGKCDNEFDDWGPATSTINRTDPEKLWEYYLAKNGLMQFEAVTSLGVFMRNKMFDLADNIADGRTVNSGVSGAGEPIRALGSQAGHRERFMWPSTQSVLFDLAPHKSGEPGFPEEGVYSPTEDCMQYYFSTIWYDVQLMVSSENNLLPSENGSNPTDWAYMASLLANLQGCSVRSQFARLVRQRVFAWQSRNNFWSRYDMTEGGSFGSRTPTNIYKFFGYDPSFPNSWPGGLHDDEAEAELIVWRAINEWVDYVSSVPTGNWDRANNQQKAWDLNQSFSGYSGGYRFEENQWGRNFYRMTQLASQRSAPATVINNMVAWGETMWPSSNFEQYQTSASNEAPSVTITTPTDGTNYDGPTENITVTANASDSDGSVVQVTFYNNGTPTVDNSSPFSITYSGLTTGSYTFGAIAEDDNGDDSPLDEVTITIGAGDVEPPTIPIIDGPPTNRTSTSLTFTFTSSTDNVGVVGYEVQYSLAGQNSWTPITDPASQVVTITGLSSFTNYDFRIRAKDLVPNYSSWNTGTSRTQPTNLGNLNISNGSEAAIITGTGTSLFTAPTWDGGGVAIDVAEADTFSVKLHSVSRSESLFDGCLVALSGGETLSSDIVGIVIYSDADINAPIVRETGGYAVPPSAQTVFNLNTTSRISRNGGVIKIEVSTDEQSWTTVYTGSDPFTGSVFGLVVAQGDGSVSCDYSNLSN